AGARRRLRDEAVQPGRDRRADSRRAAAHARGRGRPPSLLRRRHERGDARGVARRRPRRADPDRVQPPPLLHAQSAARPDEAADPRQRLALRLRRRPERRRDVRQLPTQEARPARSPSDPDDPARRLRLPRSHPLMSLRARLLAVLAVLAIVGLVVAAIATYAPLRSFLTNRVDSSLAASAAVLARPLSHGFPPTRGDFDQLASSTPGIFVQFRSETGKAVFSVPSRQSDGTLSWPELPKSMPELGDDGLATFNTNALSGGGQFRALIVRLRFGGLLIVAAPFDNVEATLHRLFLIELLVSIAVVAAIVALGLWLVRVSLRPLRKIEDTAAAIAAGDLSRRIEDANPRTEVG